MSGDVKYPKVPYQWGKIGQRVGQLWTVGLFSSATVLFRYKEIALYPRAKMLHTYSQNNIFHSYKAMGDKTLHSELSPNTHTYTYTFSDLKKVYLASIYLKEICHCSFTNVGYHLIS